MSGLFNSTVLDVAIGVVFVYLLLAIICTAANEWIAGILKTRSRMLERSVRQLLDNQPANSTTAALGATGAAAPAAPEPTATSTTTDQGATGTGASLTGFLNDFYRHPLLTGMMQGSIHPSYLAPRTFALAVMDLATPVNSGRITFDDFEKGVKAMPDGDVRKALLALLQNTDQNIDAAQKAIEAWFDDSMDRVSGWYKRRTQVVTFIIAIIITILANADTIHIVRRLWTDPVIRNAVVEQAKERAQRPRPTTSVEYENKDNPLKPTSKTPAGNVVSDKDRALLGQLIGWQPCKPGVATSDCSWPIANVPERLLGWILTILAISLGAPFWFDVLNKFMNIRSAGKSPSEAAKEPEKKKLPPEDKAA